MDKNVSCYITLTLSSPLFNYSKKMVIHEETCKCTIDTNLILSKYVQCLKISTLLEHNEITVKGYEKMVWAKAVKPELYLGGCHCSLEP